MLKILYRSGNIKALAKYHFTKALAKILNL